MPVTTTARSWTCDHCGIGTTDAGDPDPADWLRAGGFAFCPKCLALSRTAAASLVAAVRTALPGNLRTGARRSVGGPLAQKVLREALAALTVEAPSEAEDGGDA